MEKVVIVFFLSILAKAQVVGGVGINTKTPNAALHVKGFSDTSLQPNFKLVNANNLDLLTIKDDGSVTGKVAELWKSQLQKIEENGNIGWRLLGKNPNHYGNIGTNAIDLSTSDSNSSTRGATGLASFASGYNTQAVGSYAVALGSNSRATKKNAFAMGPSVASNEYAVAFGSGSTASGKASSAMGENALSSGASSMAMGFKVMAKSIGEMATGIYNTSYTPKSSGAYRPDDRAFVVGIGISPSSSGRRDGFTVLKNGKVGVNISKFEAHDDAEANLQVNGDLKIANSGDSCDADNAGRIRYVDGDATTSGSFQGCRKKYDGSSTSYEWVTLHS